MIEKNKIYCMDCLEGMKQMEDNSVDMILCDLPYGTTSCKWDIIIPFDKLWEEYKRIIKNDGVIVLTATQPFASALIMSNVDMFKYEWIWEKDRGTNFLQAKYQPLKLHENILVFSSGKSKYNPQKEISKSINSIKRMQRKISDVKKLQGGQYELKGEQKVNKDIYKFPESIIFFKREIGNNQFTKDKVLHPTQKPVELFKYLIKTYSDEGDLVLDNCMGSGTTAIACLKTKRNYIGFELEQRYVDIANGRLKQNNLKDWFGE